MRTAHLILSVEPTGWRQLLAVMGAALVLFASTGSVAAQADLISADPAPGSTVKGSPAAIRLSFSQPLESTSRINLYLGQFQTVPGVTTLVAGSELNATLAQPLVPATYTVDWLAVSDDGHSTEGSYQFAVAPADSPFAGRLIPIATALAIVVVSGISVSIWRLNWPKRL
jgi:methionine-rich copper-binding protein CopC